MYQALTRLTQAKTAALLKKTYDNIIVRKSYLNGASYKEIADKLSISTKTVDNYLQKQKRRLRIIFHDEKIDYLQ